MNESEGDDRTTYLPLEVDGFKSNTEVDPVVLTVVEPLMVSKSRRSVKSVKSVESAERWRVRSVWGVLNQVRKRVNLRMSSEFVCVHYGASD